MNCCSFLASLLSTPTLCTPIRTYVFTILQFIYPSYLLCTHVPTFICVLDSWFMVCLPSLLLRRLHAQKRTTSIDTSVQLTTLLNFILPWFDKRQINHQVPIYPFDANNFISSQIIIGQSQSMRVYTVAQYTSDVTVKFIFLDTANFTFSMHIHILMLSNRK